MASVAPISNVNVMNHPHGVSPMMGGGIGSSSARIMGAHMVISDVGTSYHRQGPGGNLVVNQGPSSSSINQGQGHGASQHMQVQLPQQQQNQMSLSQQFGVQSTSTQLVGVSSTGNGTGLQASASTSTPVPIEEDDESPLSTSELQMLSGLDSRQFGFLQLSVPENAKKKALIQKAISQIGRMLIEEQRQKDQAPSPDAAFLIPVPTSGEEKRMIIDPKTYCTLGHYHLLLEEYDKAVSAYQKCFDLVKDEYYKDSTLLYGLGLCYFHYNAFQPATEAFQKLLYVDPGFIRCNEVHLRLGFIHKIKRDLPRALKHFNIALRDQSPSTYSPSQIKFQIAHLYEINHKPVIAKENYEELLKDKDLVPSLRATVYQHLAWITHTCDALGESKSQRESLATQSLQKALEFDPRSGQALYLLGRCFASTGKVHDAFLAYRNSVDKSEGNADTWCSIGVLYQQQNQPLDALQAYICAVQLDKFHVSAWTNLGVLYESVNQPRDAHACYVNAGRGFLTKKSSKAMDPSLQQRIKFIHNGLAKAPAQTVNSKPRHLPVIDEAWNLPISAEMTARQQQQQSQRYQQKGSNGNQPNGQQSEVPAKRFKADEPGQNGNSRPMGLSTNQIQTLQTLQNHLNQGYQLNAHQQQAYNQLSHQYRLAQQQQQLQRQNVPAASDSSTRTGTYSFNLQQGDQDISQEGDTRQTSSMPGTNNSVELDDIKSPRSAGALSGSPPFSPVSDQELQAWLNQKDLGDDLLRGCNVDLDELELMDEDLVGLPSNNNNADGKTDSRVRTFSMNSDSNRHSPIEMESKELNIMMTAADLQRRCRSDFNDIRKVITCNLRGDDVPPPAPPEPPIIPLTDDQLYPQTPSVFVENKKDAFSAMLQEFCLQHPIAVVRGIAAALKLDLGLFSTKTLVEAQPEHPVEIRLQNFKNYDENVDSNGKVSWDCYSRRSRSTIVWYAQYQATSFKDSVKEEEDKNMGIHKDSDSDSKDSSGNKKKKVTRVLRFGTNVDLSDERKWKEQLQELQKLPAFARVVSAGNMLTHVGHVILGMNTVQLYMKVPGSRTPGHQENNNFCSINMNIGPGDCEWFAVPDAYWGKIYELCEKNGMPYLQGSWWPSLDDCAKAKIPVYRFTQKPGDLVWVNSGCVHWVQAMGWCNNIAWNVGPLTPRQYQLAIERYEWNKLQNFKSIVPMVHLSWNLARNIHTSDPKMYEHVKKTLMRTLTHCFRLLEFVKSKGVAVKFHGRTRTDASHYCGQCELEVFNILFIKEQEKKHVVHCMNCALKASPDLGGFVCLEEYELSDLMKVYDDFILHNLPPVQLSLSSTATGNLPTQIPGPGPARPFASNYSASVLSNTVS